MTTQLPIATRGRRTTQRSHAHARGCAVGALDAQRTHAGRPRASAVNVTHATLAVSTAAALFDGQLPPTRLPRSPNISGTGRGCYWSGPSAHSVPQAPSNDDTRATCTGTPTKSNLVALGRLVRRRRREPCNCGGAAQAVRAAEPNACATQASWRRPRVQQLLPPARTLVRGRAAVRTSLVTRTRGCCCGAEVGVDGKADRSVDGHRGSDAARRSRRGITLGGPGSVSVVSVGLLMLRRGAERPEQPQRGLQITRHVGCS